MPHEDLKRLDLRLPESHPIFRYPKGIRTKIAKEWLDIGAELAEMRETLLEIKRMLESGSAFLHPKEAKEKENKSSGFNPVAFAEKLEDFFG